MFPSHEALGEVYVAILAGGSGTRLWPLSRQARPKQFLSLVGQSSLLQQTVARITPLVPPERILVLTGPDHAPLVAAQLPELPRENILVEPSPKGTAPCLGLAALRLRARASSDQAVMLSLHADHVVTAEERLRAALRAAVFTAREGYLVTVGIVPGHPETGYGYIERGEALAEIAGQRIYHVARFTEKPPLEEAQRFVASGRYYWNTGYFAWTLGRILGEFRQWLPEVTARLEETAALLSADPNPEAPPRPWAEIQPITIDVGIMERARRIAVIPCDLGWSDVGSWAALHDLLPSDAAGNALLGDGLYVGLDTSRSLIRGQGGRLIATIGLEEMIVVDTADALLILPKSRAQDVSALVKELRRRGLGKYL
jgi:mannose-1-phosphate guanylyltransferase